MDTITVYSPSELKELNPSGFDEALENWRNNSDYIPWTEEIINSLKAVFEASGIRLTDWSIGGYSYSYVRFDMESDVRDLSGNRALAWIENNLLSNFRIPFTGKKRWELAQYGKYYRPGMIEPCPFTGYCADDGFIESLLNDIKAGQTLGEAYSNLADVANKMFEDEIESYNSEENFLEQEYLTFTFEGREF